MSSLGCQVYMIVKVYHVVCDGKENDGKIIERHRFLLIAEDVCEHITSYVNNNYNCM